MSQVKHDDTERKVTGGDPAETTRPHHEAGSGDRGGWDDWVDVEGGGGGSAGEDGGRTGNTQPVVFGAVDAGKTDANVSNWFPFDGNRRRWEFGGRGGHRVHGA